MTQISVFLTDDQAMIRQGLRMIIEAEPDLTVAGEAADGGEAVRLVPILRPDVVLMDVQMPSIDGLEAVRRLLDGPRVPTRGGSSCSPPSISTSTYSRLFEQAPAASSSRMRRQAISSPPSEPWPWATRFSPLPSPGVSWRHSRHDDRVARPKDRIAGLSPREREVLRLVCLGLTNGEIAERLILGEATVKTHVGAILGKLGARDRVAAVITGYESGLVAPGEVDVGPPLPGDR